MSGSIQDRRAFELVFDDLADDVWDSVIAVCERFEQDWSAEAKIEDYLDQTQGVSKRFRLHKLLEIDCGLSLDEMEKRHLIRVLRETGGNKVRAARILGIDRRTLYRMAERFGIDLGEGDE